MSITRQLKTMSREDKLRAMEEIWTDLPANPADLESPAWHAVALRETEQAVAAGKATFSPLEDVMKRLRRRAARKP